MQDITLGNFYETAKFLIALIGVLTTIYYSVKKAVAKALEPLNKRIDEVEMQGIKNFLVQEISEIKRSDIPIDEVAKKRFFEEYDLYIEKKQNSYIKHEVEELKKKGLI